MIEVRIQKGADDPAGVSRVSVGGRPEIGYYCVYRGTREEAIAALQMALEAMTAMAEHLREREPDPAPTDPPGV
jgi:hypothetical protein